jgi:hypothetical protein
MYLFLTLLFFPCIYVTVVYICAKHIIQTGRLFEFEYIGMELRKECVTERLFYFTKIKKIV